MVVRIYIIILHLYYFLYRFAGRRLSYIPDPAVNFSGILLQSSFYKTSQYKYIRGPEQTYGLRALAAAKRLIVCRLLHLISQTSCSPVKFFAEIETKSGSNQNRAIIEHQKKNSDCYKSDQGMLKAKSIELQENFAGQQATLSFNWSITTDRSHVMKFQFGIPETLTPIYTYVFENKTDISLLTKIFLQKRLLNLFIACFPTANSNTPGFLNSALRFSTP
jgi:hypothetical protein